MASPRESVRISSWTSDRASSPIPTTSRPMRTSSACQSERSRAWKRRSGHGLRRCGAASRAHPKKRWLGSEADRDGETGTPRQSGTERGRKDGARPSAAVCPSPGLAQSPWSTPAFPARPSPRRLAISLRKAPRSFYRSLLALCRSGTCEAPSSSRASKGCARLGDLMVTGDSYQSSTTKRSSNPWRVHGCRWKRGAHTTSPAIS